MVIKHKILENIVKSQQFLFFTIFNRLIKKKLILMEEVSCM